MDSFEWNKILGAVLGTMLFVAALNILVDETMTPKKPSGTGMTVAAVETHDGGTTGNVLETKPDWGTVLPAADVGAGEKVHQRCLQCHDFEKGGPNKIGPNLFGIVGNKHAHEPTYTYSSVMQSAGGTWGYDELNAFLTNPRAAIVGTKMTFAGLSKLQDRINLIAFLRTKADSPQPIPAPQPAAAGGADGEGPASQTQTPQPGEKPQPAAPGAAPPMAPTGGLPTASTTPAPARSTAATPSEPAPATTPQTPPAH